MSDLIRRMRESDIDAVMVLERAIPEAPHWTRPDYESSLGNPRASFVAECEGALVGFAVGKIVAGHCELESIAVVENSRGQSVGHALFSAVKNWALYEHAVRLELEVRASNQRAIKFYERMGLAAEGRRKAYYSAPSEDAILMGMPLSGGGKIL